MSIPNPLTRHPSIPLVPFSKVFSSVFWTARNRQRKQVQIWSRPHYKNGLSSLSSSTPSLHSAATSLSMRILSQRFAWSQRSYCLLLSCLLLLRPDLTGCDSQGSESTTKSHWNEISLLHQSMVGSQTRELTEGEHHQPAHHHHPPTDDNIVISHKEDHFPRVLPTRPPPTVRENGNQTSNFVSGENTASVIASSFRTFDQQQQQEDPSESSKEDPTGESNGNQNNVRRKQGRTRNCDTMVLKRCLSSLPPMNATGGIPSSPEAINTACRIYDAGINCFDTWARQCLAEKHRKKVKESITGAHEMYTFLCKDPKFRSDYLKHKVCYKKLSPHWDDCSRQFIEGLKRNTKHNHTVFCCIRLEFLTCVNKYSSYSCNREASRFLMKMAETLVRSSIRTKSDSTDYCSHVHPDNCVPIVESSGATGVGVGAQFKRMIILINSFILLFLPSVQLQLSSSKFPGKLKRV